MTLEAGQRSADVLRGRSNARSAFRPRQYHPLVVPPRAAEVVGKLSAAPSRRQLHGLQEGVSSVPQEAS